MLETIWRATCNISMTFQKLNLPLTLTIPYSGIWVVLCNVFLSQVGIQKGKRVPNLYVLVGVSQKIARN